MAGKSQRMRARCRLEDKYLEVTPATKSGRNYLLRSCQARPDDLTYRVWIRDYEQLPVVRQRVGITAKDWQALQRGGEVVHLVPRLLMEGWVLAQKEARECRERVVRDIERTILALNRLFLKESRNLAGKDRVECATIQSMDGSVLLWLAIILSAKLDFLKYHWRPDREEIPDYVTARGFIFDDDYRIAFDSPERLEAGIGQTVSPAELIGLTLEATASRGLTPEVIYPSIHHLRATVARDSGDPQLIAIYCKD